MQETKCKDCPRNYHEECLETTTLRIDDKRFGSKPLYFDNVDVVAKWAIVLYFGNFEQVRSWSADMRNDEFIKCAIESAKTLSKEEVRKIMKKGE